MAERDDELLKHGTPHQVAAYDALLEHGSVAAAADALGVHPGRIRSHLSELRRRAARSGWSPEHDMNHTVPPGFHVKGVSTYYDADGKPRSQWVKSQKDQEHRLAELLDAVQIACEPIKGKYRPVKAPKQLDEDLLACTVLGDPHVGLYAWGLETGEENFDLGTAERDIIAAVEQAVNLSPPAKLGMLVSVGDTFHADDSSNRTARSGAALDVDSRYPRVLSVTIRAMRHAIELKLKKHAECVVWIIPGNHDPHSSLVLAICLAQYYERDPRVTIDTSPGRYRYLRFGTNLIGGVHGDMTKLEQLGAVMAADRPQDWGETEHRYFLSGHVHHRQTIEVPGCIVETFRTLAPRDAWHTASGYRSGRELVCDLYHREYGRIQRSTVGIKQVRAAQEAA